MRTNPRTSEFPPSVRPVSQLFNAVYRSLYLVLNRVFQPGSDQARAVGVLYLLMADVLSELGRFLVYQPIGDGEVALPTFEIHEFSSSHPLDEVIALAESCALAYPELSTVHETQKRLDLTI